MKKLFALTGAALLALSLAGCDNETENQGGDEGKTINLVYSGTASNQTFNESLFEDFKADRKAKGDKNTYVITYEAHGPDKVDSEVVDWASGPDVYEFASDKITDLFKKGALARIVGNNANFVTENNSDLGVQLATFNDQIYAYPYTGDNTYYLQYDKSKLTADDVKTVEGILAKCEELNKKFAYNLPEGFWGGAALFTYGADYKMTFDEDGVVSSVEADFDSEKGVKAGKAIATIMGSSAWISTYDGAPSEENGVIAAIAGTWDVAAYKEALGDNYACAVMPTVAIDGDTKHLGAFLGGKLFGVNPQRQDQDRLQAAHELAKFLSNKDSQLKRFEDQNVAPCNKEAAANQEVLADQNVQILIKHAEYSHAQTAVPGNFWNAPATLITGIQDGTYSLEKGNIAAGLKICNDLIKSSK